MRRTIVPIIALAAACAPSASASVLSGSGWVASTDRLAYTGTVTRFGSEADAIAGMSPTSGPFGIPDRNTAAPYNTASRDLGLLFSNNFTPWANPDSNLDYSKSNIFLGAWYYTTVAGEDRYSGAGNPTNDNQGFVQIFDQDGSTTVTRAASFGNFDGTHWTTFNLSASGVNANFDNDLARLWNAPALNDFPDVTFGMYSQWSLDVTFGGLMGSKTSPGLVEAFDHPDSVTGTFTGIFFNSNTIDPLDQGWYRVDLTLNLDSWAFGQGDGLVGGSIDGSYFAVMIPTPGTAMVLALFGAAGVRRRTR